MPRPPRRSPAQIAFGALLGFLAALALLLATCPSFGQAPKVEEPAKEKDDAPPALTLKERAALKNKLKQFGLAFHNMHDTYGHMEPAIRDKAGKPLLSWRIAALPYVEQQAVYNQFKVDEPWDSEHNKKALADNPMPKIFAITTPKPGAERLTHFRVFAGNGALFDPKTPTRFTAVTDGLSNTLMVVVSAKGVPWTKPDELEFDPQADPRKLLLETKAGYPALLADGSQVTLKADITADTLKALITRAGGEVLEEKDYK